MEPLNEKMKQQICEILHDRIVALIPYGLNAIWFRVVRGNHGLLAALLGYRYEDLANMIQFSELTTPKGSIRLQQWGNL